jgi:hypothetical protein
MVRELMGSAPPLARRRTPWGGWVGWLLGLGAASCGAGAAWPARAAAPENPAVVYERRISGRQSYVDVTLMPASFRRITDPVVGPAYVLYADGGQLGCLVSGVEFVQALDGSPWPCRWRPARRR